MTEPSVTVAPWIGPRPPTPAVDPAAPHAFGCLACTTSARGRRAAEHVAGRLLALLAAAEDREARQRDEIGLLEERLTRHAPKWES